MQSSFKIALVGNPNSGKSTLFNRLTGLKQKVANFPGVTVEKKSGKIIFSQLPDIELIDFPGTYSLYPTSRDEKILVQVLCDPANENFPDAIIYIADITQLERHLLLFSQIKDLDLPIFLVLNMLDIAEEKGIKVDIKALSERLEVKIIALSAKNEKNIESLVEPIQSLVEQKNKITSNNIGLFYALSVPAQKIILGLRENLGEQNPFRAVLIAHHFAWLNSITPYKKIEISDLCDNYEFVDLKEQVHEIMQRFDRLLPIVKSAVQHEEFDNLHRKSENIDKILTNKYVGPVIFMLILMLIFQSVFAFAKFPMEMIETIFGWVQSELHKNLPKNWITDLFCDGIIAGISGIIVFVPQIAVLFFLISMLEDVGYMARAVFMFDGIMQKFGMNGRSIVSLVAGGACAIPAIMAARTISNPKERLITTLVTPLISCSARIPVYALLVSFVVPKTQYFSFFNAQGVVFMGLYLLSIFSALAAGWIFKKILKSDEKSSLMIELPPYRMPSLKNILQNMLQKVESFVVGAGKVIIVISVLLWALSNFSLPNAERIAEEKIVQINDNQQLTEKEKDNLIASYRLEYSVCGQIGKLIEPVLRPLGFDWKIGIALLTSFAAREVFVGTMATIYSVGSDTENPIFISQQMEKEVDLTTGKKIYTPATAMSLLIFYVFAMQCMSTLAVVKKETKTWKWAVIQFFFMGFLAYFGAWATYALMS